MIRLQRLVTLLLMIVPTVALSQSATLHAGDRILLATTEPLSSKTSAKGDMVSLRTAEDLSVDGRPVIPAGTPAVGQVVDARSVGGLGVSGKLVIRPLYLRVKDKTVRLRGAASDKATLGTGGVIGVALFAVVSGRNATIPAGTVLAAEVEKDVVVEPGTP
jgi:hypothetical protein